MTKITVIASELFNPYPMRIDKFLLQINHENLYSRAFIEKLIIDSRVILNKAIVKKKSDLVNSGDHIEIDIEDLNHSQEINTPLPENIELDIIFEDEDFIVINKAAGLTVHPAPGNYNGTLVNALIYHFENKLSSGSSVERPGIVHRLDKDTSGLLLIAKNDKMHSLLSTMIQNRLIIKKYRAITLGHFNQKEGVIDLPLSRSDRNRKKIAVNPNGRQALTKYKVIKEYDYFSDLDIELITGRTHQIRVHCSALNCPILGDETYNSFAQTISRVPAQYQKKVNHLLKNHLLRQALHAYEISFIHPISQVQLTFNSPLPDDMIYTLQWLEKNFA